MSSLSRELVFLILQFLDEEKFKESVHKLEQESGFYFNMKHFEEEVQNGNWEEVEKYLSGFTKVDDNRYSMKIFFEIRKQKYLEALDKHDRGKGVEILVKDLKVFATFNEDLYKEITQLLTLENFRENEQLSKYGDTKSARSIMLVELKKLIEANPLFRDKLQFPNLKSSRLRTLINQSLNWQHQLCKNPRPNPDIKTLFVDHSCGQANGAHAPGPAAGNPLLGAMPKPGGGGFPPLGAHGPFQPPGGPVSAPLAGWMSNPSVSHPAVSGAPMGLGPPTNPGLNHPAVSGAIGLGAPSNPIPVSAGASPISLGGPTNPERQKRPSIKIYEHADNPAMPHLPPFNSYTFPSSIIVPDPEFSLLPFPRYPAARLSLAPSSRSNNNAVGRPSPAPGPNNYVAWPSLAPGGPSNNNAARRPSPAPGGPSNNNGAMLKHPRPGTGFPTGEYPTGADSDHVAKRMRPIGVSEEVSLQVNMAPGNYAQSSHGQQVLYTPDDIPKTVARTLTQGSSPMSMDFHPTQQTILLVGTNVGDIGLWDVGTRDKLVLRNFKVWELAQCSMALQSALVKDPAVSVNRVIWSPDGSLFGVAYSKHVVQIYSYHGGGDIRQHLEIDAHTGGVNDIAFSHPNKQLCVITCGDDKTIKVWDATSGARQYIFEGHDAPVYSVCPHHKENIQFIFSTALDGKIKAWLYDNLGSRVDYDAPGHWCTTMAYSADGTRLFSCGTSKEGESYIVEWNESEGAVKRTYLGFRRKSLGVVQFDTTKNRFLAAGDEFGIKFWDMDNINILTTVDAEGGLSASPRIRFNKDGTLLAVSTSDNGIKILANADGVRLLRNFENQNRPFREQNTKPIVNPLVAAAAASASGPPNAAPTTVTPMILQNGGDIKGMVDIKPRITEDPADKAKLWKLTEISEPAQCRSLRLMDNLRTSKISRLIYTNSGLALLALASNAIHLLWKWPRNERNPTGKATAAVTPQLWQPPSGILMTNDITDTSPEEAVPSFALSKNDSYVMSASGGKISLFNMMTFKTMTTFMPPPPAATFLAFHPQDNNIIAIGMDDSTIQIYNVRVDEVKSKLKGHSKRITGLAFSNALNVLISSGADSQICVWSNDGWEKQKSKFLPTPQGSSSSSNNTSDTRVQFHHDQVNFLVVHETQIAIYETTKLECLKQWVPRENSAPPISHATFSCDSQLIYATFVDATVCIFTASNLKLRCRILPAAYLPQNVSQNVHPLVVAAHPTEPNQFAIGLTDGGVHVIEPLESEGKWGAAPPAENGSSSSNATAAGQAGGSAPPGAASSSDQPQR